MSLWRDSLTRKERPMTNQQAFTNVVKHLRRQGTPAFIDDPEAEKGIRCVYRADDGKKCAIGCLIPDDEYRDVFDDGDGYTLTNVIQAVTALHGLDESMLASLQALHDTVDPSEWEEQLQIE